MNSFYQLHHQNGTVQHEKDHGWKSISTEKVVDNNGRKVTVRVLNYKIEKIFVNHGSMQTEVEVPHDCEVYQMNKGMTTFTANGGINNIDLGRVIGLIKNNEVIEERYLEALTNQISGWRK